MKKFIYLIPAALLLFSSCASTRSASSLAGEWNVVGLNGQAITPEEGKTPFLGFDLEKSQVYGFTGCNRMSANLNAEAFVKGKAEFGHWAATRMYCQDDKYERPLFEALGKVTASQVKKSEILLKDKEGNVLLTLKRK